MAKKYDENGLLILSNSKYSQTYRIWKSIIYRCTNARHNRYYRYGARGIKICDRWLNSFDDFVKDLGECPPNEFVGENKSLITYCLDRIDNDGNYEPGNCRWITLAENSSKRSKKV